LRYCEALIQSSGRSINTVHYCDWKGVIYSSASECFSQCSPLLISKSEASFIVILVFSLFVLGLVLGIVKAVVE
jgi:hypothetical protein